MKMGHARLASNPKQEPNRKRMKEVLNQIPIEREWIDQRRSPTEGTNRPKEEPNKKRIDRKRPNKNQSLRWSDTARITVLGRRRTGMLGWLAIKQVADWSKSGIKIHLRQKEPDRDRMNRPRVNRPREEPERKKINRPRGTGQRENESTVNPRIHPNPNRKN